MSLSGRVVGTIVLISCTLLATAAPAAAAASVSGIDFTVSALPKATYSISGTVRAAATSAGVAGVSVVAQSTTGPSAVGYLAEASTNASGTYTLSHLLPGTYTLQFLPPREANLQSGYRTAAGPSHFSPSTPSPVTIHSASLSGLSVRLPTGYKISGKVTRSDGTTPIASVDVRVTSPADRKIVLDEDSTDSRGNYTLMGLTPGTYLVNFLNDPALDSQTGCWYSGAASRFSASCASSTAVSITSANVTGISPRISDSLSVTGYVMTRATTRAPIVGAVVAPTVPQCANCGSAGKTDASGQYTIVGLNPGSYTFAVTDPGKHPDGYYSTSGPYHWTTSSTASATISAATTTLATIKPVVGQFIRGTITDTSGSPIPSVLVTAVNGAGMTASYAADTDASGNYSLGPLVAGTYKIHVDASFLSAPTFQSGWYRNSSPNNFTVTSSRALAIQLTGDLSGIDMRLPLGASISGTVRLSGGGACASCFVEALDLNGAQVAFTDTSSSGAYSLQGLAPGRYYVLVNAGSTTVIDATHIRLLTNGFYKSGSAPNFSATQLGATAVTVSP